MFLRQSSCVCAWSKSFLKPLMKFQCEGHFFHLSNLFISSVLSATGADFYWYCHRQAVLPVIFSTIEQRKTTYILHLDLSLEELSHVTSTIKQPPSHMPETWHDSWKVLDNCRSLCVYSYTVHVLLQGAGVPDLPRQGAVFFATCNDNTLWTKTLWLNIWEPVTAGAVSCHFHWLHPLGESLSVMSHSCRILLPPFSALPLSRPLFFTHSDKYFPPSFSALYLAAALYLSLQSARPSASLSSASVCLQYLCSLNPFDKINRLNLRQM